MPELSVRGFYYQDEKRAGNMSGLFYKDFLCVGGKQLSLFLVVQLVVVTFLRFTYRNDWEADAVLFTVYALCMTIAISYVLFVMDTALFRQEKGARQKRFYFSLPVSKRQYVAEKYLFILIALYVIISVSVLEGQICQVFCVTGEPGTEQSVQDSAGGAKSPDTGAGEPGAELSEMELRTAMFQEMVLLLGGVCLIICSFEFAFIFAFGPERGMRIKTGLVILLFFAFILYILFGNLEIMERWNPGAVALYLQEHPAVNTAILSMVPFLGGGCYALSYSFSAWRFEGREDWSDD